MNITLPDTIGLHHCILRILPAIPFQTHQQLVHLLNPEMYEHIIIIKVTKRITNSPLLIPTALPSIVVNQFCSFVSTDNVTEKITKKSQHSISILGCMKKMHHNFQWNPPSKTGKQDDQILKASSCEISFWVLRSVSVAIVTFNQRVARNNLKTQTRNGSNKVHFRSPSETDKRVKE